MSESTNTQAKRVRWVLRAQPYPAGATTMVLIVLAERSNATGNCWPAVATLAREAGCSLRAAQYALRQLERDGWIAVSRQRSANGTNVYHLNLARLEQAHDLAVAAEKARREADLEAGIVFAEAPLQASEACGNAVGKTGAPVESDVIRVGKSPLHRGNPPAPPVQGVQRVAPQGCNQAAPQGCTLVAPKPPVTPKEPPGKSTSKKSFYPYERVSDVFQARPP